MKKAFLWFGLLLLSPVLLFALLAVLLYVPSVQNWLVDKATEVASRETGLQISIDRVDLDFPLDLVLNGVLVVKPTNDTIAYMDRAVADVKLLPLLRQKVVVNELELQNARINTHDFIADLQVSGSIGRLSVASRGIDLSGGTAELNDALIADADVTIWLSDTAAVDTTASAAVPWFINADSLSILRSHIALHMPGDSMQIAATLGSVKARGGVIDLQNGIYTVRSLDWREGALTYDQAFEPHTTEGMDYNHLHLSNIGIGLDSIFFAAPQLSLKVRDAAMKEQSGVEITRLSGNVFMDSASIRLPNLVLLTPYSNMRARVEADFNLMDTLNPGPLYADVEASVGKQDLMLFAAPYLPAPSEKLRARWPEWALSVSAQVSGTAREVNIGRFDVTLPTAFHITAKGTAGNLMDMDKLQAHIDLQAETFDLRFLSAAVPALASPDYRIPNGIRLNGRVTADGSRYTASLTARESTGSIALKGQLQQRTMSYDADVQINRLNLRHFMPRNAFGPLSADIKVKGQGTDFFHKNTQLEAEANLKHLQYGEITIDSINATADIANGHAQAAISGHNRLLDGFVRVDALLDANRLRSTVSADLRQLDLYAMHIVQNPLTIGLCGHLDVDSNLKDYYLVSGLIGDIHITDSLHRYRPEDVGLTLRTQTDTTILRMQSGNLIVKVDAAGGYELLGRQFSALTDTLVAQYRNHIIDQEAINRLLPSMHLYVTSGRDNPMAAILRASANVEFKDMLIDLTTSPQHGINGQAHVYALNADSTRIDTITFTLKDTDRGLTFQGVAANNRRNPQLVFRALLDGYVYEHGARAMARFYDDKNQLGLRLGASAAMEENGIRFHLVPGRPTIGYKEFALNSDNFLFLRNDLRVEAKVDLIADDGAGVKIYSEDRDSTMLQDLTVSLYHFDLEKVTAVAPYLLPRLGGMLNGDFHLMMNEEEQISVASDMQVTNFSYEHSPIGNLSTEFVYLQRENDTHAIEGILMLDDNEIAALRGEYRNEGAGYLDANLQLTDAPLGMVNGMIPDQLIGLEGTAEGEMSVKGSLDTLKVDGEMFLNSAYLISKPYGVRLRFDDDPVRVVDSKLLFENFTMYGYNDNPLNIMGSIDFKNTNRIMTDIRVRAQNYQLINSKQTKESIAYGKAFVNVFTLINGPLNRLTMRGRLDVLGTTDLTYLLLDSPLSTDNQMDELVKFTDFSDSTQTVVERPALQGIDVDLTISIDQGAHVVCGLNADQTNYVDLFGGGDLRMRYTNDGISLTGRYTVQSGEMKYSLPIIPLKTFTLQDGSYVEFTGDPMNPRLNLTATERTKASVGQEGQQSRSVVFDCGVVITKTLQDMGLAFTISAPEDLSVSSELNSMSTEQRGKLAVTMLTTGMYLADGNTSGFSMNSALSSFLQSEINNIASGALKTLDLSVDLDNTTDASGATHTDYSFKFAKRFWNNRLKVQIGGKVSTGSEMQGQKQSFFDNVTMEYRLTPTSNQYVELFYNQNVYDWLDGYTGEYGGGYIWKRKLSSFWDIFKIWGNEKQTVLPSAGRQSTDSIAPKRTATIQTEKQAQ